MNPTRILEDLRRQVPSDAPLGTRWKISAVVATPEGTHQVAAAARIDSRGRRREQFWCDGLRMELAVWLRLTCAERECPHAKQVRAQWLAFHRRPESPVRSGPPLAQPLMHEIAVTVGRQAFTARPARFPCFTPCPNQAHPPITIDKSGFDLFDDSGCLGGGAVESHGVRRPRIPTVDAAEAYLLARHLETLAVLSGASDDSRRRSGPTTESD